MIVVDTNVIAYCWLQGERTAQAQRLRRLDPDWHVPVLWRPEFRNVLAGYLRDGSLNGAQVREVMGRAEAALAGSEHHVPSGHVFGIVERSKLSACDAEFAALAAILGATLVTEDRAIIRTFPEFAVDLPTALAAS